MSPQTEVELIAAAKLDPDAFAQLYDLYIDRLYRFVRRRALDDAVAEDITALTFEKALRALPTYQPKGAGFGAWLYRIARNELISYQRKQRWLTALLPTQVSTLNLDWIVEHNEAVAALRQALAKLAPADQELLALRFFEELSNPDIAEVLGCPVANVYVRLHRALKRLEQQFTKLHGAVAGEVIHVLE